MRSDLRGLWLSAFQSAVWNRLLAESLRDLCRPEQLFDVAFGERPSPFFRLLDESQRGELLDLRLPLPSARLKLEAGPLFDRLHRVLAEFGLELCRIAIIPPRRVLLERPASGDLHTRECAAPVRPRRVVRRPQQTDAVVRPPSRLLRDDPHQAIDGDCIGQLQRTCRNCWIGSVGRDFDVLDAAGRLGHGQAIFSQSFDVDFDGFEDASLSLLHRCVCRHTARQIGNVRGVVRLGLFHDDCITLPVRLTTSAQPA